MLIYKIDDDIDVSNHIAIKKEDINMYMNKVMTNYLSYYDAPNNIQKRYDFVIQAIYSCLSKINNEYNNINESRKELEKFLISIENISGIKMRVVVFNNNLYVKSV